MNTCNFIGRLTKDPEVKVTSNQRTFCNFTIAVDRGYKDANGNKLTDFIPCVAWDPTANIIAQYFKKGNRIGVTGSFESRLVDNNGDKKSYYNILVNHVDFIQDKEKSEAKPRDPEPEPPREASGEDYLDLPFGLDQ